MVRDVDDIRLILIFTRVLDMVVKTKMALFFQGRNELLKFKFYDT